MPYYLPISSAVISADEPAARETITTTVHGAKCAAICDPLDTAGCAAKRHTLDTTELPTKPNTLGATELPTIKSAH